MGHRKSSAALLIVFERNFYCLARTTLARAKNARVTKKGVGVFEHNSHIQPNLARAKNARVTEKGVGVFEHNSHIQPNH